MSDQYSPFAPTTPASKNTYATKAPRKKKSRGKVVVQKTRTTFGRMKANRYG